MRRTGTFISGKTHHASMPGDTSAPALPTTDIDGDNRRINNPEVVDTGNGIPPIVDMGADEYVWKVKFIPAIPSLLLNGSN